MSKYAVMPLADYVGACETIREKTGTTDAIKSDEMTEKINVVYEAGKQAEYDRFWDILQENGNRIKYQYCFAGKGWTDELFKPKYPIVLDAAAYTGYSVATFMHTGITNINVPIIVTENTSLQSMCHSATELETIHLLKLGGNNAFTYTFLSCSKLKNIAIEGIISTDITLQYSPSLTKASIQNIVSVLTDGATATFSKTAVNNAFKTSDDKSDGSTSEEWLNLVATKPNCTITLI